MFALIVGSCFFDGEIVLSPYHRFNERHADLLVLDIGGVQADGDDHSIKNVEDVLFHCQRGTLNTHTEEILCTASDC